MGDTIKADVPPSSSLVMQFDSDGYPVADVYPTQCSGMGIACAGNLDEVPFLLEGFDGATVSAYSVQPAPTVTSLAVAMAKQRGAAIAMSWSRDATTNDSELHAWVGPPGPRSEASPIASSGDSVPKDDGFKMKDDDVVLPVVAPVAITDSAHCDHKHSAAPAAPAVAPVASPAVAVPAVAAPAPAVPAPAVAAPAVAAPVVAAPVVAAPVVAAPVVAAPVVAAPVVAAPVVAAPVAAAPVVAAPVVAAPLVAAPVVAAPAVAAPLPVAPGTALPSPDPVPCRYGLSQNRTHATCDSREKKDQAIDADRILRASVRPAERVKLHFGGYLRYVMRTEEKTQPWQQRLGDLGEQWLGYRIAPYHAMATAACVRLMAGDDDLFPASATTARPEHAHPCTIRAVSCKPKGVCFTAEEVKQHVADGIITVKHLALSLVLERHAVLEPVVAPPQKHRVLTESELVTPGNANLSAWRLDKFDFDHHKWATVCFGQDGTPYWVPPAGIRELVLNTVAKALKGHWWSKYAIAFPSSVDYLFVPRYDPALMTHEQANVDGRPPESVCQPKPVAYASLISDPENLKILLSRSHKTQAKGTLSVRHSLVSQRLKEHPSMLYIDAVRQVSSEKTPPSSPVAANPKTQTAPPPKTADAKTKAEATKKKKKPQQSPAAKAPSKTPVAVVVVDDDNNTSNGDKPTASGSGSAPTAKKLKAVSGGSAPAPVKTPNVDADETSAPPACPDLLEIKNAMTDPKLKQWLMAASPYDHLKMYARLLPCYQVAMLAARANSDPPKPASSAKKRKSTS